MKDLLGILKDKRIHLTEEQKKSLIELIKEKKAQGYSVSLKIEILNGGLNSKEYMTLINNMAAMVLIDKKFGQGELVKTPLGPYILGSKFVPSYQADVYVIARKNIKGKEKEEKYVLRSWTIGEVNFEEIKRLVETAKSYSQTPRKIKSITIEISENGVNINYK